MSDEKLKFKDMLLNIKVIDSNDKVKKLADCVESEFEELVSKITEYNQDGEINIKLKLKVDKKTKHGIDVYGEVTKKCPRGVPKNSLYRDENDSLGIRVMCPLFENIEAIIDEAEFIKKETADYKELLILSDF